MPLRTIIKVKGEESEHNMEKPIEIDEDESSHRTTFSKTGIVSAIRKTIAKYSLSRPHSPVSSRPTSPKPLSSTSDLDEDPSEVKPPKAPPLVKNTGQIKQRPPPRPKLPLKVAKNEKPRKDTTNNHTTFEIPPPPPELLSSQDLYALFSGAPVFSILKNGNESPEPRVFFPFDEDDEELEGLSDCPPIAHPAFSLCTSRPHRPLNPDARGRRAKDNAEAEELGGSVEEEPSMLSFMGIEPGTCGWEYFIMYPVGDFAKVEEEEEDRDAIDEGGRERGRRGSMGNGKGGVRSVETDYIVERLKELGEIWNQRKQRRQGEGSNIIINNIDDAGKPEGVLGQYSSLELYTQLFTRLLYPPTRITTEDFHDPYSLKVQVVSLLETLAMKKFWLDFKDPHWRIRIGQILWGRSSGRGDDSDDEEDEDFAPGRDTEKVWLLLQILLACELAVRLDVLFNDTTTENTVNDGFMESKEDMCRRFKSIETKKVEWDILLARRWLDNVWIIDDESTTEKDTAHLAPPASERRGWFSSRPIPPSPPPEIDGGEDHENGARSYEALIYPRDLTRQFSALIYFARCLQWPQIETLSLHLQEKIRSPSSFSTPAHSVSGTPIATPLSMMSASTSSYFQTIGRRKRIQELASSSSSATLSIMASSSLTRPSALMKTMGSGGWLSRTYFSGLILPGEGLPHFLISTLLENDSVAVDSLGDNSILYAGFQYEGSTWWSSNCIVGRVLAGYGGSKEVGGWIGPSLGVRMPTENGMAYKLVPNGWLNVCSLLPEGEEESRVLNPHRVKEESNPLGTEYRVSQGILTSDLSMPKDGVISSEEVLLETLVLIESPREDGLDTEAEDSTKFNAELHFQLGGTEELAVKLMHEVFFITSFPCLEPHSSIKNPETDSEEQKKSGHPLHKEFGYNMLSIESLVLEHDERKGSGCVLVIEAGGERRDRGVLARAWCAERGVHAIVGGRGRTCLSCCIREAKALSVGVVIRVG